MKISVIIPTVRDTTLNEKSLKRQTFRDFEVIIQRPTRPLPVGNFYQLNHDYNEAIKKSKGELIISYQDQIEIPPDTLERFWEHFKMAPQVIVGAVGDQYSTLIPPVRVWTDPRKRVDQGTFYMCYPIDIEFTLCSIPRKALYDVGGFDESYDAGAAVGEKELMLRMDKAGYKPYLDQSIEYRALAHPRLFGDEKWNNAYKISNDMFQIHAKEIAEGRRSKVDFLL